MLMEVQHAKKFNELINIYQKRKLVIFFKNKKQKQSNNST